MRHTHTLPYLSTLYCRVNGNVTNTYISHITDLPSVGSSIVLTGKIEEMEGVRISEREGEEERLEKAKKEMEGKGRTMPKKKSKVCDR